MIARLQSLRFIAAGLVLIGHTLMEMTQHGMNPPFGALLGGVPWGAGVDIFFVISGFIIALASADRPRTLGAVGDFLAHRIIRVWPIYAFFTLLMLVAVLLVPSFLRNASVDIPYLSASLAFVPWPRPTDGQLYPLLGQGWTLNYEMFFYLSFACVLLLPRAIRTVTLCIAGAAFIGLGLTVPLPPVLDFYSQPIIAEFLFGVFIARMYPRLPSAPVIGAMLIAAAFAYLLIAQVDTQIPSRALFAGIPAALIVTGFLMLGEWGETHVGRPVLVLLGNASYALYLCHPFVVNALLWIYLKRFADLPGIVFGIAAIVGSILASVVTYLLLERPVLRLLKGGYKSCVAPRAGTGASPTKAS